MDTKASILIVDDRPDKLLALEAVLEDLNQDIVRAYSGREALRHILNQDFAVILLDVNMPGMDGFETASLIRQRSNSRHTPIIFITAFGDEMLASRGYSLGAVDYILTPVVPDVLRTKVGVFVDLFAKSEQVKRQAESLHRRASQMQKLAAASLAINAALSIDRMLQTITDTARDIIGAHQAITLYLAGGSAPGSKTKSVGSFSDKYASWKDRELKLDIIASTLVAQSRTATRMSEADLMDHPDWEIVKMADIPPVTGGMLSAPLTGRDGTNLGVIYLSDRYEGYFSRDDEAVLVQLAQMGSIAIENTVYAEERQVNRIKDEFLATLSHELRTPLNAILGWTQLLQMEKLEGDIAHGVDVIDRNARAQTKLIEDLLDVSRITSGKLRLNLARTTLAPVVSAAVEAARPTADAKKITLELMAPDDNDPISIDPDRIQQVVWNLLSNAIKFTPVGGKVWVRIDRLSLPGGDRLALRVADTGQGIDGKFLPFVFDRFRQADSTSTRSQGGLGIGLAIVRHIVELHGGSVTAESPGAGRGSTFTIELPVMARASATITPAAVEVVHPQIMGPSAKSLRDLRVIVVDDEADARDVIAVAIRRAGAEVVTASSVVEAMSAFNVRRPDLLVSDIAMPEHDGYSLIRQIRQRPPEEGGDLPAIALTAYAGEEDRARAIAAGFHIHLAKPVDQFELISCIAELIADQAFLSGRASNPEQAPTPSVLRIAR